MPGWLDNPRETEDEARWRDRLAQLAAFREGGNGWPRTSTVTQSVNTPSACGSTAFSGTAIVTVWRGGIP